MSLKKMRLCGFPHGRSIKKMCILASICIGWAAGVGCDIQRPANQNDSNATTAQRLLAGTGAAALSQVDLTHTTPLPNSAQRTLEQIQSGKTLAFGTEYTGLVLKRTSDGRLAAYPLQFLDVKFAAPEQNSALLPEMNLTIDVTQNQFQACMPPDPLQAYQDLSMPPLPPPTTWDELLSMLVASFVLNFISGVPDIDRLILAMQVHLTHQAKQACFAYSFGTSEFAVDVEARTLAHFWSNHTWSSLDHHSWLDPFGQTVHHMIKIRGKIQNGSATVESAIWRMDSTEAYAAFRETDQCYALFISWQCINNTTKIWFTESGNAVVKNGNEVQLSFEIRSKIEARFTLGVRDLPTVSSVATVHL